MEAERPRPNPLVNPAVLKILFQQSELDFGDLKNARLVCKEWYFESLPRWRKTAVITVSALDWERNSIDLRNWCATNYEEREGSRKVMDVDDDNEGQWDVDKEDVQNANEKDSNQGVQDKENEKKVDDSLEDWDAEDDKGLKDVDNKTEDKGAAGKCYPTIFEYLHFLHLDCHRSKKSDLMENKLSAYPYVKLKLINWNEFDYVRDGMWALIGKELEYLHLESCEVVDDEQGWLSSTNHGVINKTVNELPKLNTLLISAPGNFEKCYNLGVTVWDEKNRQAEKMIPHLNLKVFDTYRCKVDWSRVLKCFPNLRCIRDSHDEFYVDSQDQNMLADLVYHPSVQESVKSIDFIHSRRSLVTEPILRIVGNLYLNNLTYLSVALDTAVNEAEAQIGFNKFFQRNRNLKIWKIFRDASSGQPFREFPDGIEMASLKELHFYGNVTRSLDFIRFTQNLEKLVIYFTFDGGQSLDGQQLRSGERFSEDLEMNALIRCGEDRVKPLEKLETLWTDVEFSLKALGVVKRWMPKLKGLRTILNKFSFRRVCSMWGEGLEELVCLTGSTIDDWTLVGTETNVTSLTDLRRLSIEEREKVIISDGVIRDGFLEMKRLEVVELPVEVESQMSSEAIELLKKKIVRLEIN